MSHTLPPGPARRFLYTYPWDGRSEIRHQILLSERHALNVYSVMRICHFSDSHLGAGEGHRIRGENGLTLRQQDLVDAFIAAIDGIIALRPDLCVHSGDLFHAVRPANRIMAIVGEQLSRLSQDAGIPTVIISGNHDAPRQTHVTAALDVYRPIKNLYVSTGDTASAYDFGEARVFALPHSFSGGDQRHQLEACRPGSEYRYNILVMHGVAAGMPQFAMAELGEQEVPLEATRGFDYTALGHYHNFYRVAPRVYYAGSTERLSQAERESAKGFVEVNLEKFSVTFHKLPVRGMVDIPDVDARNLRGDDLVTEIERRIEQISGFDKIVRVTVTGATEATLKTVPQPALAELKRRVFDLDIRYVRDADESVQMQMGRHSIGRLDEAFVQFLDSAPVDNKDRERLRQSGLGYLKGED